MSQLLEFAKNSGFFNSIDYHFAKSIGQNDPKLELLALLVSHAYGLKHSMIPFTYLKQPQSWITHVNTFTANNCSFEMCKIAGITPKTDWQLLTQSLRLQNHFPVTITDYGIYLTKNFIFEQEIVNFIYQHQKTHTPLPSAETIKLLHKLFPSTDEVDKQKLVAANTLISPVSIISGGPGTGKTTTVIKILILLLQEHPNLHISLAAPTGKAAARLNESIEYQKNQFITIYPDLIPLLNKIPKQSMTLHRLLNFNPDKITPTYHAFHPLPTDLLIIDEASMIDLAIFNQLIKALPSHARIIILGDKDQLSSVEAGAIMSEVCQNISYSEERLILLEKLMEQSLTKEFPIDTDQRLDNITLLTKSHRFSAKSGIGQLASIVNQQQADKFQSIIQQFNDELSFIATNHDDTPWFNTIIDLFSDYAECVKSICDPKELFESFNQVRVLCATNVSEFGTGAINLAIGERLFKQKEKHKLYHGQTIIISQNDYPNNIYNGDIGIIVEKNGQITAYFETDQNEYRAIPVQLLPKFETAFAMTIHKSQGSEFSKVLIILPDFTSRILTKELLYTGITRAKHKLTILGTEEIIKKTILQRTERFSGIAAQLKILKLHTEH